MRISILHEPARTLLRIIPHTEPGTEILYWTGRCCGGQHKEDAYTAYAKGDVELIQRRNGQRGLFDYIAVKRKERRK